MLKINKLNIKQLIRYFCNKSKKKKEIIFKPYKKPRIEGKNVIYTKEINFLSNDPIKNAFDAKSLSTNPTSNPVLSSLNDIKGQLCNPRSSLYRNIIIECYRLKGFKKDDCVIKADKFIDKDKFRAFGFYKKLLICAKKTKGLNKFKLELIKDDYQIAGLLSVLESYIKKFKGTITLNEIMQHCYQFNEEKHEKNSIYAELAKTDKLLLNEQTE